VPKTQYKQRDGITISTVLSPEDAAKMRARAKRNDRNVAGEIRHILAPFLSKEASAKGRGARQDASPQSSVSALGHASK
jgi:hypothetical protein